MPMVGNFFQLFQIVSNPAALQSLNPLRRDSKLIADRKTDPFLAHIQREYAASRPVPIRVRQLRIIRVPRIVLE